MARDGGVVVSSLWWGTLAVLAKRRGQESRGYIQCILLQHLLVVALLILLLFPYINMSPPSSDAVMVPRVRRPERAPVKGGHQKHLPYLHHQSLYHNRFHLHGHHPQPGSTHLVLFSPSDRSTSPVEHSVHTSPCPALEASNQLKNERALNWMTVPSFQAAKSTMNIISSLLPIIPPARLVPQSLR